MRKICSVLIGLILCGAIGAAAQDSAKGSSSGVEYVGTWTGTWEGSGTGGFELTLEKSATGTVTGRVSVTGEPTYKAAIKTLSFDGTKMTAQYEFPPDPAIEVRLQATFDGKNATGTWSARQSANGSELANGTWTVTKK